MILAVSHWPVTKISHCSSSYIAGFIAVLPLLLPVAGSTIRFADKPRETSTLLLNSDLDAISPRNAGCLFDAGHDRLSDVVCAELSKLFKR